MDTTHRDILGQQRVNHPEGRTKQGNVLDEDSLTLVEVNHLGAQTVLRAKATLVHGHTILGLLQQTGTGSLILGYATRFHAEARISTPRPPSLVRTATINSSLTCDGNILGLVGINQGTEVPTVQPFPTCRHDGVEFWLKGKLQDSTFLHDEVDTTLQLDSGGEELLSGRHNHTSTALLGAFVNSFLNGFLILGCRMGNLGTKLGNGVLFVGKLRNADALFNLLVLLLIPSFCLCGQGYEDA